MSALKGAHVVNRRFVLLLILAAAMIPACLGAQPRGGRGRSDGPGSIRGSIVDSTLLVPLEYANVILFEQSSQSQIDGTISRKDGQFLLTGIRPGIYSLEAKFMGYHASRVEDIEITFQEVDIDIGTIALRPAVLEMEAVEVSAERPDLIFKIDKKVINVGKQITAASGTAVDVLENVPSVTVDIEGNVSLRGSTSFTVLIDSRPTVLEPSEVLQQIPASTIDNIEIITNPSAKYDPDGVSGIINIITKKQKLRGASGTVNLNAGLDEKYGGDFLLYYRRSKLNVYVGADYNKRMSPGTSKSENRTETDTVSSYLRSSGSSTWGRTFYGAKAGFDLNITDDDLLSSELRVGQWSMESRSEEDFEEWTGSGDDYIRYISMGETERSGPFYSGSLDYRHSFARKDHEIAGQVVVSGRTGDEESTTELLDMNGKITSGQRSVEEGPSRRLRTKVDYVLPLRQGERLEAGYQSRFDRSEDVSRMYEYDPATGEYEFQPYYSHSTEYDRDIHALYTIYSGGLDRLGYQAGLRGEYTYRSTGLVGEDTSYTLDRWDLFPTIHVSYEYSEGHQTMASYTRRIERPRGWYLQPFLTWRDAYTVWQGNASLKPEYIDSYELGYQRSFGNSMFSAEGYYRVTHNKIERVQSVYEDNVMLHTVENVGKDYTLGTELMLNLDEVSWWSVSLLGDLRDHRVAGTLYGDPFSRESFSWRTRWNNTFRITKSTRLQINGRYNSSTVTSQGERGGSFTTDAAIRQEFMSRQLSINLQVRDLLGTSKFEFESEGPGFYSHREFDRKSPVVMLTVSYNFNNYRPDRQREQREEEFEEEGEF
jgi:outer membrane cobalamin receptor